MKTILISSTIILLSFFINSCTKNPTEPKPTNNSPQIKTLIAIPSSIIPSDSCQIICNAEDEDGDDLEFIWQLSGGLMNGYGDSIIWISPAIEGSYKVSCKVIDGKGGEDTSSVHITVSIPKVLFMKGGDPTNWTISGGVYSQYEEIQHWKKLGFSVTTKNFSTTTITDSLLENYNALRIFCGTKARLDSEGESIYNWISNGGCLFADISWSQPLVLVSRFGIQDIVGQHGGSSGLNWYYHGAPWVFGPVTGPSISVNSIAAESMDHPILSSSHNLTVDASISVYPIIVHGEFGSGKVVMIFAQHWSHDKTKPNNAYRATIFQRDNIQFLENCINYFKQ